jgi:hypothetical protein
VCLSYVQEKTTAKYSNTVLFHSLRPITVSKQVQQNRSVVQVHQSHAKSARSHNKTRWGQLNSVPMPPSPHTSRLSFLFSYFLSVSSSPIACFAAFPSRADPNNSSKDSPKMCFSTAFHLATVLLTHLIVSAAPLKHTTDPGTMQVLGEMQLICRARGIIDARYSPFFPVQISHTSSKISRRNSTSRDRANSSRLTSPLPVSHPGISVAAAMAPFRL